MDFSDLSKLLELVEAKISASDIHGFLCGQICICGAPQMDMWQEFMDAQSNDDDLVDSVYNEIQHLVTEMTENLLSPDMEFELFLPDGSSSINDRIQALSDWCHGFLNGFGLGEEQKTTSLTEDCREVLDDYTKICRAGLADSEEEEEDEVALLELIEYACAGARLIFEERFPGVYPDNDPMVIH